MAHQYHTSASISTWLEQAVRLHFIAISSCGVGLSTLFTVGPIKGGKKWGVAKTYGAARKNMFVKAKTARSVVNSSVLEVSKNLVYVCRHVCTKIYGNIHDIHVSYMSIDMSCIIYIDKYIHRPSQRSWKHVCILLSLNHLILSSYPSWSQDLTNSKHLGTSQHHTVRGSLATLPIGHLRPYPLKTRNTVTCDPTSFYCAHHTKLHLVTCDPTHHY